MSGARLALPGILSQQTGGGGGGGGASDPDTISGLALWLDADQITGLSHNDPVSTWPDASGNSRDAAQANASLQPVYRTNVVNGKPAVRFDPTALLDITNFASGFTAGELFVVLQGHADPPLDTNKTGLHGGWDASGQYAHYPYTNGIIYDPFGSTTRHEVGNPTPSLTTWRLYNVRTASGAWSAHLDSTELYSTASNTVDFGTADHRIGSSRSTHRFDGDIAEWILYDNVISSSDRAALETYIADKYALTF